MHESMRSGLRRLCTYLPFLSGVVVDCGADDGCNNRLKERELENERKMFLKAQKVRELEERLKPMLANQQDATNNATTTRI